MGGESHSSRVIHPVSSGGFQSERRRSVFEAHCDELLGGRRKQAEAEAEVDGGGGIELGGSVSTLVRPLSSFLFLQISIGAARRE